MTSRADIATAASSVTGVSVTPYYRQSTKPGDGFVSLIGLDPDAAGIGYMERWAVTVVLSQDIPTAEKWIESNVDSLLAALEQQLVVTAVVPTTLSFDTAQVPGLSIEGSKGH